MLSIALTVPGLAVPHGGIRVIIEWANRLSVKNKVVLFCRKGCQPPAWINISPEVTLTDNLKALKGLDRLIVCSPHDVDLLSCADMPKKKLVFLQMLEHMFRPFDQAWMEKCNKTYAAPHPLILISEWNKRYIENNFRSDRPIYYVGNGVNFDDFPLLPDCPKDGHTILIEGWEASNPSKDVEAIGPQAAKILKKQGYRILAYGQLPLQRYPEALHGYFMRPSLEDLNGLYEKATVLIKASRYDARSCAPMEAMTKGCVTVRSINNGDDDLIHGENSVRLPYNNVSEVAYAVDFLIKNRTQYSRLKKACIQHVKTYSWEHWMPQIEEIIENG